MPDWALGPPLTHLSESLTPWGQAQTNPNQGFYE